MKLWEIKAESLRLMFADYEMQFNYEEFADGIVYNNSNTREKLIRMNDSIRRGIDIYYNIVGDFNKSAVFNLKTETIDEEKVLYNTIDLSTTEDLLIPTRVDMLYYNHNEELILEENSINYSYDNLAKEIYFTDKTYIQYDDRTKFRVWYKIKRFNIPYVVDELTFELDDIYISEEAQRLLPYYVKGELYEEDEPNIASEARNYYLQSVSRLIKRYSAVQTRVKRSKVFNK